MTQDNTFEAGQETVIDEAGGNIYDEPQDTNHMRSSDQINAGVYDGADHGDRLADGDVDDDAVLVEDEVVVVDDGAPRDEWR